MASISSFDLFPQLPREMRLSIWRFCHPGPRIVTVEDPRNSRSQDDRRTICPHLPALLSVCQESRNELLRYYSILKVKDSRSEPRFVARLPFDLTLDTMAMEYVRSYTETPRAFAAVSFFDCDWQKIENISLVYGGSVGLNPKIATASAIHGMAEKFPSLKTITLIGSLHSRDQFDSLGKALQCYDCKKLFLEEDDFMSHTRNSRWDTSPNCSTSRRSKLDKEHFSEAPLSIDPDFIDWAAQKWTSSPGWVMPAAKLGNLLVGGCLSAQIVQEVYTRGKGRERNRWQCMAPLDSNSQIWYHWTGGTTSPVVAQRPRDIL